MNNNTLIIFLSLIFLLVACSKKETAPESYYQGNLTVYTDESFKSVTEALAESYMVHYPETKIAVSVKKEDLGFLDLLDEKAKIVVMSRELSKEEIAAYEKHSELKFLPAKFAADAVLFIVPKDSPLTEISVADIKKGLEKDSKQFIFDGTNSSNLNFVAQKIGQKPSALGFSVIPGNENVVKDISKYPGKVGVIGLNTVSRLFNSGSSELRNSVKILPVRGADGRLFAPDVQNLRTMEYPFTRVLYFLTNEPNFGISNGLIRFSCTQIGQMVVEKEGLQPYNLFKREVQFNK